MGKAGSVRHRYLPPPGPLANHGSPPILPPLSVGAQDQEGGPTGASLHTFVQLSQTGGMGRSWNENPVRRVWGKEVNLEDRAASGLIVKQGDPPNRERGSELMVPGAS